jgi:hypothetical protein
MNFFGSLPKEIVILIYEFNPEHRKLFRNCFTDIRVKGTISRLKALTELFYAEGTIGRYSCLTELLVEFVNDPDYMIIQLNDCKCCSRHQTFRPKNVEDPNWLASRYGWPDSVTRLHYFNCECDCRHYSRQLVMSTWQNELLMDEFEGEYFDDTLDLQDYYSDMGTM